MGRGEAGLPSVELVCSSPTVGVGEQGGVAGRGRRSLHGGGVGGLVGGADPGSLPAWGCRGGRGTGSL